MSSERQLTLAVWLQKALKSVAISRGESDSLDSRTYRQSVLRSRQVYDPLLRLQTLGYRPRIMGSGVREAILNLLRDELKEFISEDRTYSASYPILGGMGGGSLVEDILENLVRAAIVEGPEASARAFYDSIASQIHRLTAEMGSGGADNVLVSEFVGGKSLDLMVMRV